MSILENLGDLGGLLVGFLLTIAVLSFVIKDNPLYRLAIHILVGFSAGYALVILVREVFLPVVDAMTHQPTTQELLFWLVAFLLAILLLLKVAPKTAWLGNSAMAALVGVGAAVGLVGAISGTLLPQVVVRYDNPLIGLMVALLAILVLAYFIFNIRLVGTKRATLPGWYLYLGTAGRVVLTMTLAGLFAGALNTSLVLLMNLVGFYSESFTAFLEVIGP